MLADAGFGEVTVSEIESDPFNNYYIARKCDDDSMRPAMPLPQTSATGLFVTDGGLETELVFHDGIDLPCFAAFPLLDDPDDPARLRRYYDGYLDIARKHRRGLRGRDTDVARQPGLGLAARLLARSSSTPSTGRRSRSPRRSGRPRRPTASPPW